LVKRNQPLLHAQISALPWRQVPAGISARETGHGRAETRTLKAAHATAQDLARLVREHWSIEAHPALSVTSR
jgi:hypothetical protein